MIGDLCHLELVESSDLPPRTLVAPLMVVREIRAALGRLDMNVMIGPGPAVLISSDLYEAFGAWTAREGGEEAGDDEQAMDEPGLN
jgi:hypothetical protein